MELMNKTAGGAVPVSVSLTSLHLWYMHCYEKGIRLLDRLHAWFSQVLFFI